MKPDIEIAREAEMRPIGEIADSVGLTEDELFPYGRHIAKIPLGIMERLHGRPDGHMILVTAMTPTKYGEGKTTITIGLGQALARIGKQTMIAVREPSLGPCMGHEGRGRRGRLVSGAAHGGDQSPLHRRSARGLDRPQPVGGGGGQPSAPSATSRRSTRARCCGSGSST